MSRAQMSEMGIWTKTLRGGRFRVLGRALAATTVRQSPLQKSTR